MKKLVAVAALLLSAAAIVPTADAGCAVVRKAVVVQQHAYVAPYVAPLTYGYTGYYNAGYDAQQALIKDQAAFIKLQTEAYQQLRQALTQPRGEQPGAGLAVENFEAFATQQCLRCHQDGTARAEESGFIMFEKDGKLSPFSIAEKRRMATLIEQGQMPPNSSLSQQQRQQAKQLLGKK